MSEQKSFAAFVKESRERKKNEALAQDFLGSRGRKANASGAGALATSRTSSQKPNLLSRMSGGIQKQRSSSAKPTSGKPTGSIDGKWQHDLHKLNNPNGPPANSNKLNRTVSASQIERNTRTFEKFTSVMNKSTRNNESTGFNIKGVATGGPYTVIASNFAPGTTAADIEAVMAPHGGETLACRIISSAPTVMVELQFTSKEGAENVIAMFNNQKADGRQLYVYLKETPNNLANSRPPPARAIQALDDMELDTDSGARGGSFQDGRFGFKEGGRREPPRGPRRRF